jgi:hypothetical protein
MQGRSLQVKVVKDGDPNVVSPPLDIDHLARVVTRSVVSVIGVYISMDILRKATVYILTSKI